jgi:hypothetical protein
MTNFKIIRDGWIFPLGSIISEDDLPEGRSVGELVKLGIISPNDGKYPIPLSDKDAKGWKLRCGAVEKENADLRTATTDAALLGNLKDLEAENDAIKARVSSLEEENARLKGSVVSMDQFRDTNAELQSLKVAHEELQKNYGKLATENKESATLLESSAVQKGAQ